jgi:hypothetical protein
VTPAIAASLIAMAGHPGGLPGNLSAFGIQRPFGVVVTSTPRSV